MVTKEPMRIGPLYCTITPGRGARNTFHGIRNTGEAAMRKGRDRGLEAEANAWLRRSAGHRRASRARRANEAWRRKRAERGW